MIATVGGESRTAKPTSPGAGIPSGAKITPDVTKLFKENLEKMSGSTKYLEDLGDLGDLGEPVRLLLRSLRFTVSGGCQRLSDRSGMPELCQTGLLQLFLSFPALHTKAS